MWKTICFLFVFAWCPSLSVHAQKELPVRQEPRHRNVFENAYLRILDVHIRPSDTTLYHLHETPSVIIVFTDTRLSTQVFNEYPESGHTVPGSVTYVAFEEKPTYHRVINNDTSVFHVMDIELLGKEPSHYDTICREPDILPAWQEKRVNAYTLYADAGQSIQKAGASSPMLLVCVNGTGSVSVGSSGKSTLLSPGSFLWIDPGNPFLLRGSGVPGSGYVLLTLHR